MPIVIECQIPQNFGKQSGKWIPPEQRGRICPFPALKKNLVLRRYRSAWPQAPIQNGFHCR